MNRHLTKSLLIGVSLLVLASAALSCGDDEQSVNGQSSSEQARTSQTRPGRVSSVPAASSPADAIPSGPVMPNVDPAEAEAASEAALQAFGEQLGGEASVVWGPNIVEGWAIMGMADAQGDAMQEVLLQKDNSGWTVRDIGQSIAETWKDRTPAGLWP